MSRYSIYSLIALAVFGHWGDMLLSVYLMGEYAGYELNPLTVWWWSVLGGPTSSLSLVKDFVTLPIFAILLGYYCLTGKNVELVNALRIFLFVFAVLMVLPTVWNLYVFAVASLGRS